MTPSPCSRDGRDTVRIPSKVLGISSTNWMVMRHGATTFTRTVGRYRRHNQVPRSDAYDRAFTRYDWPADYGRRVSEARAAERLDSQKCTGRFHAERSESLDFKARSKPRHQAPHVAVQLDQYLPGGYGSPVAVNPAADLGRSNKQKAHKRPTLKAGAFFVPAVPCYGGCAWDTFGCAGSLLPRSANPRTAATLTCLAADGGSSPAKGATPMQHALNPSASHAAAWKARALAALRGNSSLSVRLARYNAAMARARALEAQEAQP